MVWRSAKSSDDSVAVESALQELGHEVSVLEVLPDGQWKNLPTLPSSSDILFAVGEFPMPALVTCVSLLRAMPLAVPPVHTLAMLEHPLHWRRILERESVPVQKWLVLERDRHPARDPRVSVLGFPLSILPTTVGTQATLEEAWDRDQLTEIVDRKRLISADMLLVKVSIQETLSAFLGLRGEDPLWVPRGTLSPEKEKLSLALVRHVKRILELAGPCRMDLVWEQERLFLRGVSVVTDLGPMGDAFQAIGGSYEGFLRGIVETSARGLTPTHSQSS